MISFKLFLEQEGSKGALYAFDIDGTLKHPTARIGVKDPSGNIVATLDHHTYNTYKLPPGHSYDYDQFKSANIFHQSQPIRPMIAIARSIQRNMPNRSKMVFITARADFDNREKFLDKFRQHGLNMDVTHPKGIHVHRAGNLQGVPTSEAKLHFFRKHLETGGYKEVHFWDDDDKNLADFLRLKQQYPQVHFNAYKAHPDGTFTRHK